MLRFEFAGVDDGVATTLAQDLRSKLIENGASPDELKMVRKNESDMNLGDILQAAMSLDMLALAEKGLTVAVIAHCAFFHKVAQARWFSIETRVHGDCRIE